MEENSNKNETALANQEEAIERFQGDADKQGFLDRLTGGQPLSGWFSTVLSGADPKQLKAGGNIAAFLGILLALTLIARGTSGATLAKVSLSTPERAQIADTISATGSVAARDTLDTAVPEGLKVEETYVGVGQTVESGDPIAKFGMDEINSKYLREKATLDNLNLELEKLQRSEAADSSSLDNARTNLDRAQEDLNSARASANASVFSASQALEDARSALYRAQGEGDENQIAQAENTVKSREEALSSAESKANSDINSAQRRVEDAQNSYENAQTNYSKSSQAASDTNRQNANNTVGKKLDIEAQKAVVDKLERLRKNNGLLYSDFSGLVTAMGREGATTAKDPFISLMDSGKGFEAAIKLAKADADRLSVLGECEVSTSGGSMYFTPTVKGAIHAIGAPDDEGDVPITVRLPGTDWTGGQRVTVQVVMSRNTYETCVPLSALHSDNSGYFVYVVEQQKTVLGIENAVAKAPVSVTISDNEMAAISGSIGRQSQIITSSNKSLSAGDRIRVE